MEEQRLNKPILTDIAKTALRDAGVISQLKQAIYSDNSAKTDDAEALKGKAQAMADDLQQVIDSGTLSDVDAQKLSSILTRLRGALQGGSISREALVMALSEASTAISTANGTGKSVKEQQKTDQLWQEIEQHNNAINDDFEKMQSEGIVFDKVLWEKHRLLLEHMQANPRDIEKQKELDAVDDLLLKQAESQLLKYPDATPSFEHAKKESEERHEAVDQKLAAIQKKNQIIDADSGLDWGIEPVQSKTSDRTTIKDVTINDVEPQNVGQNPRSKNASISLS